MKRLPLLENKHSRSPVVGDLFADRVVDARDFISGEGSIGYLLRLTRHMLHGDIAVECALQTPFFALESLGRTFLGYAAFLRAAELWNAGFRNEENVIFDVSPGLGDHIARQLRRLGLDGLGAQFYMLEHFALSEMAYAADLERFLSTPKVRDRKLSNLSRSPDPFYQLTSDGVLRRAYRQLWNVGEILLQVAQCVAGSRVAVEPAKAVTPDSSRDCC